MLHTYITITSALNIVSFYANYTNASILSLGGFLTGFHPETGFWFVTIKPRTQ